MKLKVNNKKFIVNNNVVVCILTAQVSSKGKCDIADHFMIDVASKRARINGTNPYFAPMIFKGIAKCKEGDSFDERKGKILAESRAMEKLKKYSANFFYECANTASNLADMFNHVCDSEAQIRRANSSKINEILMEL